MGPVGEAVACQGRIVWLFILQHLQCPADAWSGRIVGI